MKYSCIIPRGTSVNGRVAIIITAFDILLWIMYYIQWLSFFIMMGFIIVRHRRKKTAVIYCFGLAMIREVFIWIKLLHWKTSSRLFRAKLILLDYPSLIHSWHRHSLQATGRFAHGIMHPLSFVQYAQYPVSIPLAFKFWRYWSLSIFRGSDLSKKW